MSPLYQLDIIRQSLVMDIRIAELKIAEHRRKKILDRGVEPIHVTERRLDVLRNQYDAIGGLVANAKIERFAYSEKSKESVDALVSNHLKSKERA